jgi:hypothetical protein
MSMSDFKVKLALKIIGDHFGNIVRDVAKIMTEGDCCTLQHLVRTAANSNTGRHTGSGASGAGTHRMSYVTCITIIDTFIDTIIDTIIYTIIDTYRIYTLLTPIHPPLLYT